MVHVPAPLYCPTCEKPTELIGQQKQWQTDFPVQQATTTEFQIDVARCTKCGRQLRARHADQTSDAVGSAAVQIGPRAVAFAAKLNKECGISVRTDRGSVCEGIWAIHKSIDDEPSGGASGLTSRTCV